MENVSKWRKKPVVITAMQWDSFQPFKSFKELVTMAEVSAPFYLENTEGSKSDVFIKTLEGEMRANHLDFIIRGVKGEIYPCKPDIFTATYESVNE